jgi:hypothetical protein
MRANIAPHAKDQFQKAFDGHLQWKTSKYFDFQTKDKWSTGELGFHFPFPETFLLYHPSERVCERASERASDRKREHARKGSQMVMKLYQKN